MLNHFNDADGFILLPMIFRELNNFMGENGVL